MSFLTSRLNSEVAFLKEVFIEVFASAMGHEKSTTVNDFTHCHSVEDLGL